MNNRRITVVLSIFVAAAAIAAVALSVMVLSGHGPDIPAAAVTDRNLSMKTGCIPERPDNITEPRTDTNEITDEETHGGTTAETEAWTVPYTVPATDPPPAPHTEPVTEAPQISKPPVYTAIYPPAEPLVIVDAGHGFGDPGCIPELLGGLTEKELTLDMAGVLCTKLESKGFRTLMVHNGKEFPSFAQLCKLADSLGVEYEIEKFEDNNVFSPYERAIYANCLAAQNGGAVVYISIHVNTIENKPDYSGFEIDYCVDNPYSEISKQYFDGIISEIKKNYPSDRIKAFEDSWEMGFVVTKHTRMPSLLFETGFATNKSDAARLLDPTARDKLMQTLADAIGKVWGEF